MEDNVIVLLKSINATLGRLESASTTKENKPADTASGYKKTSPVASLNSGLGLVKSMANDNMQILKNVTPAMIGAAAVNITKLTVSLLKYKLIPGKEKLLKGLMDFFILPATLLKNRTAEKLKEMTAYTEGIGHLLESIYKYSPGIKTIAKQEKYINGFKAVMNGISDTVLKIGKNYDKTKVDNALAIVNVVEKFANSFKDIGKGLILIAGALLGFVIVLKLTSMILGVSILESAGIITGIFVALVLGISGALMIMSKRSKEVKSGVDSIKDIAIASLFIAGSVILLGIAALIFSTEAAREGIWWAIGIFAGMGIMIALMAKYAEKISAGSLVIPIIAAGIALMALSVLAIAVVAALIGKLASSDGFMNGVYFIGGTILFFGAIIAGLSFIPKTMLTAGALAVLAIAGIMLIMSIAMLKFAEVATQIQGKESTLWSIFNFMVSMIAGVVAIAVLLGAAISSGIGALILGAGLLAVTAIIGIFVLFANGMKTVVSALVELQKVSEPTKAVDTLVTLMKSTIKGFSEALSEVSLKSLAKSMLGGNKMIKSLMSFVSSFVNSLVQFSGIDGDVTKISQDISDSFKIFISMLSETIANSADLLENSKDAKKIAKIVGKQGFIRAISNFVDMLNKLSTKYKTFDMVGASASISNAFATFINTLSNNIDTADSKKKIKKIDKILRGGIIQTMSDFFNVMVQYGNGKYKGTDDKWYDITEKTGESIADNYYKVLTGFANKMTYYDSMKNKWDFKDIGKGIVKFIDKIKGADLEPIDKLSKSLDKLGTSLAGVYDTLVKLDSRKNIVIAPTLTSSDPEEFKKQSSSNKTTVQGTTTDSNNSSNNSSSTNNNQQPIVINGNNNSNESISDALRGKTIQVIFNDRSYDGILNIV